MSNCEVEINGKKYLPLEQLTDAEVDDGGKRIVVLHRGWVVVGDYLRIGTAVTISNASVVRYWGTTNGLGELAEKGPMDKTKLDPSGTVRCHEQAVVLTMDCSDAWN